MILKSGRIAAVLTATLTLAAATIPTKAEAGAGRGKKKGLTVANLATLRAPSPRKPPARAANPSAAATNMTSW